MALTENKGDNDIFTKIREHYGEMSKTQRRIADYFLEHADVACFQSLKETAAAAQTTEATILKFCSRVGYDGFLQFKRELQEYIKLLMSPNEKIGFRIRTAQDNKHLLERVIETEKRCLDLTFNYLVPANLEAFVSAIQEAKRVWVVGHRVSEAVARYLVVRLQQVGIRAAEVDVQSLYEAEQVAVHADQDDLFIIISFPYYASQTRALVEYLGQAGIKMVCITDRYSSPVAAYSSAVLVCNSDHEVFYNSITAAVSLVSVIAAYLVMANPEHFENYRSRIERFDENFLENDRKYQEEQQASRQRTAFHGDKLTQKI